MFTITLTDFGNVADFESHKKGRPDKDEVFLKIGSDIKAGKAVPKVEFERAESELSLTQKPDDLQSE